MLVSRSHAYASITDCPGSLPLAGYRESSRKPKSMLPHRWAIASMRTIDAPEMAVPPRLYWYWAFSAKPCRWQLTKIASMACFSSRGMDAATVKAASISVFARRCSAMTAGGIPWSRACVINPPELCREATAVDSVFSLLIAFLRVWKKVQRSFLASPAAYRRGVSPCNRTASHGRLRGGGYSFRRHPRHRPIGLRTCPGNGERVGHYLLCLLCSLPN